MIHFLKPILLSAVLVLASPIAWAASDPVQQHNTDAVWFENWIGLSNATMVVASPDGEISRVVAEVGTPVFQLERGTAVDGVYRYELRATTDVKAPTSKKSNRRNTDGETVERMVPFYTTGFFIVERGVIVTKQEVEEEEG